MTSEIQALEITRSKDGVGFWIHVSPRSRRRWVGGTHGGALRVHVNSAPIEGRANDACRTSLAQALGVAPAAVTLEAGARARRKRVKVSGEAAALERRLWALAEADRNER